MTHSNTTTADTSMSSVLSTENSAPEAGDNGERPTKKLKTNDLVLKEDKVRDRNSLRLLFIIDDESVNQTTLTVGKTCYQEGAKVETEGEHFSHSNNTVWRKYDFLELLGGHVQSTGNSGGKFFDDDTPNSNNGRVDFRESSRAVALLAHFGGPSRVKELFTPDEGTLTFNGINPLLASHLLRLWAKPHLCIDGTTLRNKKSSRKKMADDKERYVFPDIAYTRLKTIATLIQHHPKETARVVGLNFQLVVLPNMRTTDPGTLERLRRFFGWDLRACKRVNTYPPMELEMMFAQREDFEDSIDDIYLDELKLKRWICKEFPADSKESWSSCFCQALKYFDDFAATDATYSRKGILDKGLVCKLQSSDPLCNHKHRVLFVKPAADVVVDKYLDRDLSKMTLNLTIVDRHGSFFTGNMEGSWLSFEPYVADCRNKQRRVFAHMTKKSITPIYQIDTALEASGVYNVVAPPHIIESVYGPSMSFCKKVASAIKYKNHPLDWSVLGHENILLRFDIFPHGNGFLLNQVNISTTCDAFLCNADNASTETALKLTADGLKNYIEGRMYNWAA